MTSTPSNDGQENLKVGHAGLYVDENNAETVHQNLVDTMGTISEIITRDIPLGIDKGGKTLIDCEQGIKAFVRDELAGTKDNPVDNHLPNSETGVWIYYLTKGIERDFGRSWEKDPKAIAPKLSSNEKKASAGKRVITKAEKNDLLMKRDMGYWMPMVSAGKISIEDAAKEVAQVAQEILDLEKLGIYLSENTTDGVNDYNPDRAIIDAWGGNWNAIDIMRKYGIKVIIPTINETFFASKSKPKLKYYNAAKGVAQLLPAVFWIANKHNIKGGSGGFETKTINSIDDIWSLVPEFYNTMTSGKNAGTEIKGLHIGRTKATDKDQVLIADTLNIKSKKRIVFILDNNDGITSISDDIWYNDSQVANGDA